MFISLMHSEPIRRPRILILFTGSDAKMAFQRKPVQWKLINSFRQLVSLFCCLSSLCHGWFPIRTNWKHAKKRITNEIAFWDAFGMFWLRLCMCVTFENKIYWSIWSYLNLMMRLRPLCFRRDFWFDEIYWRLGCLLRIEIRWNPKKKRIGHS